MGIAEKILPMMLKWVSVVASSLMPGTGWLCQQCWVVASWMSHGDALWAARGVFGCSPQGTHGADVMGCTGE